MGIHIEKLIQHHETQKLWVLFFTIFVVKWKPFAYAFTSERNDPYSFREEMKASALNLRQNGAFCF